VNLLLSSSQRSVTPFLLLPAAGRHAAILRIPKLGGRWPWWCAGREEDDAGSAASFSFLIPG
jgi:hypothetical protein